VCPLLVPPRHGELLMAATSKSRLGRAVR
jgi:hypothetical protein